MNDPNTHTHTYAHFIAALFALVLVVEAVVAREIFGSDLDGVNTFESPSFALVGDSLLNVFVLSTGKGWTRILYSTMEEQPASGTVLLLWVGRGGAVMGCNGNEEEGRGGLRDRSMLCRAPADNLFRRNESLTTLTFCLACLSELQARSFPLPALGLAALSSSTFTLPFCCTPGW